MYWSLRAWKVLKAFSLRLFFRAGLLASVCNPGSRSMARWMRSSWSSSQTGDASVSPGAPLQDGLRSMCHLLTFKAPSSLRLGFPAARTLPLVPWCDSVWEPHLLRSQCRETEYREPVQGNHASHLPACWDLVPCTTKTISFRSANWFWYSKYSCILKTILRQWKRSPLMAVRLWCSKYGGDASCVVSGVASRA